MGHQMVLMRVGQNQNSTKMFCFKKLPSDRMNSIPVLVDWKHSDQRTKLKQTFLIIRLKVKRFYRFFPL